MEKNLLLRAALAYADRLKWPVFPLKPNSKQPITKHGYKDATLDELTIRDWWKAWPKANIGIPTGIKFWVLDVDPRHGGDESLRQLVAKHTALADTIRQTTGAGGKHYLYELPDQLKIACHQALWPGIDVKGEGGYIVAAPSIHPDTAKEYVWDTAKKSILEESINPANPWLLVEMLAALKPSAEAPPFQLPEKIQKGQRHPTLFKMAASMRAKNCGYDEILAALLQLNQTRCEEPYPREHIEKLTESICKRYAAGATAKPAPPKGPKPVEDDEARGIYDANYPDPVPLIDAILYPGLTILGGRPKVGKSWLALQLALAAVSAQNFCGYLPVKKTFRCTYFSLEDRRRQIRTRLRRLTPREEYLRNLRFVFELDPLMTGGAASLDQYLAGHPSDLIIVDSLLAAVRQAKRGNVDALQADYNIVDLLRQVAEKHMLALVVVAHTRKAGGDFLDMIQGTSGTTAAADAVWVLQRTPEGNATLSVTGREVENNVYELRRENGEPAWTITGEGDEVTQSEARKDILQLLRDEGPMKPSRIAQQLHKNISGVHRLLCALCDANKVIRTGYGTYDDAETPHATRKDGKEKHVQ